MQHIRYKGSWSLLQLHSLLHSTSQQQKGLVFQLSVSSSLQPRSVMPGAQHGALSALLTALSRSCHLNDRFGCHPSTGEVCLQYHLLAWLSPSSGHSLPCFQFILQVTDARLLTMPSSVGFALLDSMSIAQLCSFLKSFELSSSSYLSPGPGAPEVAPGSSKLWKSRG